tara:strand:- start:134 stop:835 length:702 start_codon:yes stop_codon:yes gene_type:complete
MRKALHRNSVIKLLISLFQRKSFALNGLDRKLYKIISKKNGVFIEAGANNGIRQSNTLFLEKYYGWNGILIEPIPVLYEECKKNRTNAIVEQCALVSSTFTKNEIKMTYCNLMSITNDTFKDENEKVKHLTKGKSFLKEGEKIYDIDVPVKTLNKIIEDNKITKIDLLILDIEGYEFEALNGLDLDRHKPEYILIEVRKISKIYEYLKNFYFIYSTLSVNKDYSDILFKRIDD